MVTIGLLDDCTFGWSDLLALWLIVQPLATLLAVHVLGAKSNVTIDHLFSECPGLPLGRYRPLVLGGGTGVIRSPTTRGD